ncbi:MAG: hypothetical protein J7K23_07165 [Thermoproteales archaeon]|nr:hypothetical protein [Thermoproteales archaeon]
MFNKKLFISYILIFLLGMALGIYTISKINNETRINHLETEIDKLRKRIQTLEENISSLEEILKNKDLQIAKLEKTIKQCNTTIILLPDTEYYNIIKKLISNANKSIYLAMYSIKYDPYETVYNDPVNMLLKLLIEAHNKGIEIKILVDDKTNTSYRQTIKYLKNHGIEIKLDPRKDITTHVKILIIDSTWIIIGSHNWTESALWHNNEYSVLIENQYYAKKMEQYFYNLWKNGRNC